LLTFLLLLGGRANLASGSTNAAVGWYITQTTIGITFVVDAVLLVGIVVNNAIMVETANPIREEAGVDRQS
jgi:multidrug efflux pump subunit AcrB